MNTRKVRTINKDKVENVLCVNAQLQRVYMICFFIFLFFRYNTLIQLLYKNKFAVLLNLIKKLKFFRFRLST